MFGPARYHWLHLLLRLRHTRVEFLRRTRLSLFTLRGRLIIFRLGQTVDEELLSEADDVTD